MSELSFWDHYISDGPAFNRGIVACYQTARRLQNRPAAEFIWLQCGLRELLSSPAQRMELLNQCDRDYGPLVGRPGPDTSRSPQQIRQDALDAVEAAIQPPPVRSNGNGGTKVAAPVEPPRVPPTNGAAVKAPEKYGDW